MLCSTKWQTVAVFICVFLVLGLNRVRASSEIMKKLSVKFASTMDECKNELQIGDDIENDAKNYWKEDYALVNRDFGCLMSCLATKADMLDDEHGRVHHRKTSDFAIKHGADEETAKKIVDDLHACSETHSDLSGDKCIFALEVSKCFKVKMHELKWVPNFEDTIEEILTEI